MQLKNTRWLICCTGMLSLLISVQPSQADQPRGATDKNVAAQLPARKPGLWEVTLRSDDLVLPRRGQMKPQAQTVLMCTDPKVEAVMLFAVVPGQEHCTSVTSRQLKTQPDESWAIHTTCSVHGNPVQAQMQITGDLQSRYHGTYEVKFPNSPISNTGRVVFDGRWLGDCKPGQKPGDMVLPNGVTVNVPADKGSREEDKH